MDKMNIKFNMLSLIKNEKQNCALELWGFDFHTTEQAVVIEKYEPQSKMILSSLF